LLSGTSLDRVYAHINGFQSELRLADQVADSGAVVVKWGGRIGSNGNDIISVNPATGEVVLWDSKYRSASTTIGESPTYRKHVTRENAVEEAIRTIRANMSLPPAARAAALQNLRAGNYTTRTVAAGEVRNSVARRYCGGMPC
jgi:filamentous hemagglutinin